MSLEDFFVSARTLQEYRLMFNLTDGELSTRIIDCAAGAASFTGEIASTSPSSVALDRIYGMDWSELKRVADIGTETAIANINEDQSRYNWTYPSSLGEHRRLRTAAKTKFLSDYQSRPDSYVCGSIFEIPFPDQAFDLALCSHFLFTYANIVNKESHIEAIRELLRVAKTVRVFPTIGFGFNASKTQKYVVSVFEKTNVDVRIVDVGYNFLKGSGRMLEIRNSTDYEGETLAQLLI